MEFDPWVIATVVLSVALVVAILLVEFTLRAESKELEETRKKLGDAVKNSSRWHGAAMELSRLLDKERQEKENHADSVQMWTEALDGSRERIKQLQSALKAIGEMAEESSHL